MENLEQKTERLMTYIEELTQKDTAVAFSGGADSSLLLRVTAECAHRQGTKVYAITADTELHPAADLVIAKKTADEVGAKHLTVKIEELENAGISDNPPERCYLCKKYIFQKIIQKAEQYHAYTILEGTNADDLKMYRPGLKAVKESGVRSPLMEAGLTKQEVRVLAGRYGMAAAERPAAPCLATRFPYGTHLTYDALRQVEKGEAYLKQFGFYNVRLRVHGGCARIEVDEEKIPFLLEYREEIVKGLKEIGYTWAALDLAGFHSGSMDAQIAAKKMIEEQEKWMADK